VQIQSNITYVKRLLITRKEKKEEGAGQFARQLEIEGEKKEKKYGRFSHLPWQK